MFHSRGVVSKSVAILAQTFQAHSGITHHWAPTEIMPQIARWGWNMLIAEVTCLRTKALKTTLGHNFCLGSFPFPFGFLGHRKIFHLRDGKPSRANRRGFWTDMGRVCFLTLFEGGSAETVLVRQITTNASSVLLGSRVFFDISYAPTLLVCGQKGDLDMCCLRNLLLSLSTYFSWALPYTGIP